MDASAHCTSPGTELAGSKRGKEGQKSHKTHNEQDGQYPSASTLNRHGRTPRSKDIEWLKGFFKKFKLYAVCERRPLDVKTYRLKVKGCKKIFQENGNQNRAGVAIVDFKSATVTRHKER